MTTAPRNPSFQVLAYGTGAIGGLLFAELTVSNDAALFSFWMIIACFTLSGAFAGSAVNFFEDQVAFHWLESHAHNKEVARHSRLHAKFPDDLADSVINGEMIEPAAESELRGRREEERERQRLRKKFAENLAEAVYTGELGEHLAEHIENGRLGLQQARLLESESFEEEVVDELAEGTFGFKVAKAVSDGLPIWLGKIVGNGEISLDEATELQKQDWSRQLVEAYVEGRFSADVCAGIQSKTPIMEMPREAVEMMWGEPHRVSERVHKTKTTYDLTYFEDPDAQKQVSRKASIENDELVGWEIKDT